MEALERRALLMLVVAGLLVLRAAGLSVGDPTWLTAIYMFGLACLAGAGVLLIVVIAPAAYIGRWDSERDRLLFFAFGLLVSNIVVALLMFAYAAYEANARFG